MVEECTINVGFHSHFGRLRQCGRSKTPLRSAISDRIPFNPTYDLYSAGGIGRSLRQFVVLLAMILVDHEVGNRYNEIAPIVQRFVVS